MYVTVNYAMHRGPVQRNRPLFPFPLTYVGLLREAAVKQSLDEFISSHFAGAGSEDVWAALGCLGLNGMAGFGRASSSRKPTDLQLRAAESLRVSTRRVVPEQVTFSPSAADAEKELSSRFVT